jgi:DNA replication protein DnaC
MTEPPEPRSIGEILRSHGVTAGVGDPLPDGHMDAAATAAWRRDRARRQFADSVPAHYRHATADHPAVTDWITRYQLDPAVAGSLLLLGNTGTGKSWQAYGAIRAIAEGGVAWRATSAAKLYASLRPGVVEDFEAAFAGWSGVPLLLLDDLGAAKPSTWIEEITYRLIDERYADCLPTIITSNLTPREMEAMFGDRTVSRLAGMCTRIVLEGRDRRLP